MSEREKLDIDQGVSGGRYSALKIFHHPAKLEALSMGEVTAPIYVRIKPTNECSHNCFYCVYDPEFSDIHPTSDRAAALPQHKMSEVLDDLADMGVKAVTYSGGGEPLSYPHIAEAFRKTLDSGIGLSLITNGQGLCGESAELLRNADWVRVSLDYCGAEMFGQTRRRPENEFSVVKDNIASFAKERGPDCDLGVNCVVNHLNHGHLVRIAEFCKGLGVDSLRFAPLWKRDFMAYHAGFKDEAISQLEAAQELQDDNFSVGSTYWRYFNGPAGDEERTYDRCFYMEVVPVIAADQKVYTCHNNAYDPAGMVGSIKDQRFKSLWFSPETAEFFRGFDPRQSCKHECANDGKNLILNEWVNCGSERVVDYV